MNNKPKPVAKFQNNKTQVLFLEDCTSFRQRFTVPKGSVAKVISLSGNDSALVEWNGNTWEEIYIQEEFK